MLPEEYDKRRSLPRHLRTVRAEPEFSFVVRPATVRDSALRQMVRTFFNGSAANAATALLGLTKSMSADELAQLQRAIDEAKERQS